MASPVLLGLRLPPYSHDKGVSLAGKVCTPASKASTRRWRKGHVIWLVACTQSQASFYRLRTGKRNGVCVGKLWSKTKCPWFKVHCVCLSLGCASLLESVSMLQNQHDGVSACRAGMEFYPMRWLCTNCIIGACESVQMQESSDWHHGHLSQSSSVSSLIWLTLSLIVFVLLSFPQGGFFVNFSLVHMCGNRLGYFHTSKFS